MSVLTPRALTAVRPTGLKATLSTEPECPVRVCSKETTSGLRERGGAIGCGDRAMRETSADSWLAAWEGGTWERETGGVLSCTTTVRIPSATLKNASSWSG